MENIKKQHPYDCIKIVDRIANTGQYLIQVLLDCSCGKNVDETIVTFADNKLLSAEDNFKGWFTNTCSWFIQNGYRIVDTRQGKECSNEN